MPTGDGQKLSLRAQSNGANFQSYTFSFSEPWFGGKKPNNLSVMMNHMVNSFDYRLKTDPLHQSLTSTLFLVNFGKRLKWPDDFFNISLDMSFQKYRMKNMDGGFYEFLKALMEFPTTLQLK